MGAGLLTRRRALQMAAIAAGGLAAPAVRRAAAETATAQRGMVLAWHTNIAARWLDPQQHDGTATPDNFLNALHDGLIKNSGTQKFDHLALAERYEFVEDAKSWLHIDIPAWVDRPKPGRRMGAEANGARLLYALLKERYGR